MDGRYAEQVQQPFCAYSVVYLGLTSSDVRRHLNVLSVHLISSRTGDGMKAVCKDIMNSRSGRDVYILGASNVGKSMFISGFVEKVTRCFHRGCRVLRKFVAPTLRTVNLITVRPCRFLSLVHIHANAITCLCFASCLSTTT